MLRLQHAVPVIVLSLTTTNPCSVRIFLLSIVWVQYCRKYSSIKRAHAVGLFRTYKYFLCTIILIDKRRMCHLCYNRCSWCELKQWQHLQMVFFPHWCCPTKFTYSAIQSLGGESTHLVSIVNPTIKDPDIFPWPTLAYFVHLWYVFSVPGTRYHGPQSETIQPIKMMQKKMLNYSITHWSAIFPPSRLFHFAFHLVHDPIKLSANPLSIPSIPLLLFNLQPSSPCPHVIYTMVSASTIVLEWICPALGVVMANIMFLGETCESATSRGWGKGISRVWTSSIAHTFTHSPCKGPPTSRFQGTIGRFESNSLGLHAGELFGMDRL